MTGRELAAAPAACPDAATAAGGERRSGGSAPGVRGAPGGAGTLLPALAAARGARLPAVSWGPPADTAGALLGVCSAVYSPFREKGFLSLPSTPRTFKPASFGSPRGRFSQETFFSLRRSIQKQVEVVDWGGLQVIRAGLAEKDLLMQ